MGYLTAEDKTNWTRIRAALARRGLTFRPDDDWEVHGPHQDMNYQVFVGYARPPESQSGRIRVAIYPWAVYTIVGSRWWEVTPDDRIPTLASVRKRR